MRFLAFAMTKFPRLDFLTGRPDDSGGMTIHPGILAGHTLDVAIQKPSKFLRVIVQSGPPRFTIENVRLGLCRTPGQPLLSRPAEIGARPEENQHVPIVSITIKRSVYYFEYIALYVIARSFTRQQVATPGIMSTRSKGIAHHTAEFAGNENSHNLASFVSNTCNGPQLPLTVFRLLTSYILF